MRGRVARLQRQFLEHFDRLFAPREVFLRSDGRVKYIPLSRRQQLTAAAAATGFAGWSVIATAGLIALGYLYMQQHSRLDESGAQLRAAQQAYVDLRQQVSAAGARFTEMTQALWYHQQNLLDVVGAHVDDIRIVPAAAGDGADRAKAALSQVAANLRAIAAGEAALRDGAAVIAQRMAQLEASRRQAAALSAEVASLRGQIEQLIAASDGSAAERQALQGRLNDLSVSLTATTAEKDRLATSVGVMQRTAALIADDRDALRAQVETLKLSSSDAADARKALVARLDDLRVQFEATTAENQRLAETVTGMQKSAAMIAHDRNALRAVRDDLSTRIAFLESRMATMQSTQQSVVKKLAERTRLTVAEVEKTVLMTGLDVDSLLAAAADKIGSGGPFVPAARAVRSVEERQMLASIQRLDGEVGRWEQLQAIMRNLPLAAPLDNYLIMSSFGDRQDPINGRSAFHAGVDLKNEVGTPVLATAPGKVVYAGWMGDYGRVVEIDHGLGIHTRYAHLKSIDVKVDDQVEFRQEVGKVGSSGRSTGPHLHYEVQVNGKPHDPMNFMEAGKYVFKG